jgi:histidyl-tRNA synthetase
MQEQIQAIRGMSDLLPSDSALWQYVEATIRNVLLDYGYQEIRVPIVERTELFKRSIGEVTDIVEKEMYSFDDRNGMSITLRPEATAGIVRACMEHGLLRNQRQKFWSTGPMFRYEKPQKGRYRQFHQFDVEALGFTGPDIDAELIIMLARIWRVLRIEHVSLQINTLGTTESRVQYRADLMDYFRTHFDQLDEDSRRRLERNPLRILDSKNPDMQGLIAAAPRLTQYLDAESEAHFNGLRELLDDAGVPYVVNPRLVRGLDYYGRTVFEWVTDRLGTRGQSVPVAGMMAWLSTSAASRPRLSALPSGWSGWSSCTRWPAWVRHCGYPDVYVVAVGEGATRCAFRIAESLRNGATALHVETNCGGGGFKAQMKRADRSGATVAVLLGEDEVNSGTAVVKPLRTELEQTTVPIGGLADAIAVHLRSRP